MKHKIRLQRLRNAFLSLPFGFYSLISFSFMPALIWSFLAGRLMPYRLFIYGSIAELFFMLLICYRAASLNDSRRVRISVFGHTPADIRIRSQSRYLFMLLVVLGLPLNIYSVLFSQSGVVRTALSVLFLILYLKQSYRTYYAVLFLSGLLFLLTIAGNTGYSGNDPFRTSVASLTILGVLLLAGWVFDRHRRKARHTAFLAGRRSLRNRDLLTNQNQLKQIIAPVTAKQNQGETLFAEFRFFGFFKPSETFAPGALDREWTNFIYAMSEICREYCESYAVFTDRILGSIPDEQSFQKFTERVADFFERCRSSAASRGQAYWKMHCYVYKADWQYLTNLTTGLQSPWNRYEEEIQNMPVETAQHRPFLVAVESKAFDLLKQNPSDYRQEGTWFFQIER